MSNYEWSNKEILIKNLKLSESTGDFLNNQGLVATSGNYHTFKKWMKFHGIDKDQYFKTKAKPLKKIKNNTDLKAVAKEDILCFNSNYSRKEADKIIRKENLISYKCRGCGNEGQWCGKSITLQLEHKNGDSTDHRIENLEYLCPNCHSQTLTYGSKNKHNRIFEARLRDLVELKEVKPYDYDELAKKWKCKRGTVLSWINQYINKINEKGIKVLKEIEVNGVIIENGIHQIKDMNLINLRLREIELLKNNEQFKKILSKSWGLTSNGVKKWIKRYAPHVFNEKYILTPSYKFKLHKDMVYKKVLSIIEKSDNDKDYNLSEIRKLFNNKEATTVAYLKSQFSSHYKLFYPMPNCKYCSSSETTKFGWRENKEGKTQRYKCLDCNKQFYENIIKTLDMVE